MKRILFLLAMVLLIPSFVWAAQFLVCDLQAGVTKYEIEVNGVVLPEVTAEPDGSLKWSVDHLTPGPYIFRARAVGAGGWWSDFSDPFDVNKPGKSGNVRIIKE